MTLKSHDVHAEEERARLVTVDHVADLWHISRTHAWWLVRHGIIPSVRLSERIVRVPLAALQALAAPGGQDGAGARVSTRKDTHAGEQP
jgi:hypothetical protein